MNESTKAALLFLLESIQTIAPELAAEAARHAGNLRAPEKTFTDPLGAGITSQGQRL